MRVTSALLSLLAFGVAGLLASAAEAGHRHHRHHFHPRVIFYTPFYYPPPYYSPYYYSPPYYQPAPVYIEQAVQPAAQPGVAPQMHSGSYWYCPAVAAYYPSAPSCVAGWQKVPPPPPPPG